MDLETNLAGKISLHDVRTVVAWAAEAGENRERLMVLAKSEDRCAGRNALRVLAHMASSESEWLVSRQSEFIGMLMAETDAAKKRHLLKLLREQEYSAENIPTDLLDYCLTKINSECEPYAVRASSIHLAYKMCRHYPELVAELEQRLAMLGLQSLSPGLKSARGNILKAINRRYSKG